MKKCPYCAEEIKEEAIKCKHCGASLLQEVKEISSSVNVGKHPLYGTSSILGLVLPYAGIVLGIIYLTKPQPLDRKLGENAIVYSIIGFILEGVILSLL